MKTTLAIAATILIPTCYNQSTYTQKPKVFHALKLEVGDNNIANAGMKGLELGSICLLIDGQPTCIKNVVDEKVLTYHSQAARDIFGNEDTSLLIGREQKLSCGERYKAVALGRHGHVLVTFGTDIISGDEIDIDVVEPAGQGCSDIKIPYVLYGVDEEGHQTTLCTGDSNQRCKVR